MPFCDCEDARHTVELIDEDCGGSFMGPAKAKSVAQLRQWLGVLWRHPPEVVGVHNYYGTHLPDATLLASVRKTDRPLRVGRRVAAIIPPVVETPPPKLVSAAAVRELPYRVAVHDAAKEQDLTLTDLPGTTTILRVKEYVGDKTMQLMFFDPTGTCCALPNYATLAEIPRSDRIVHLHMGYRSAQGAKDDTPKLTSAIVQPPP